MPLKSRFRETHEHHLLHCEDEKIKGMTNMFNKNDPLLYQLGFGHLLFVKSISNKLLDSENLIKLNEKSLEFRNKKK